MSDTNFQPIFEYLDERFSKLEDRLGSIEEKVGTLQTSTDGLTKIVKDYQDEHIILSAE